MGSPRAEHDRRRRLVLGASLHARVGRMAVRHRRTVGDEIVFLVELALRAPREAPVEPRGDLASDPARSGRAYMAYHPEVDNLIVARIRRTNESISQAVRTLLRHGIAISDAREAEWRERCAVDKDST